MQANPSISARSLQYYVIARRWLSDLEFFKVETSFLQRLLDKHIAGLQDMNHIHQLIATGKALKHLQDMEVEELLTRQVRLLELMSEDIIPEDTNALASTQVKLANFMTNLTREFRQVKQDLFNLVLDTAQVNNNITT
jgi:hypothetical protein